MATYELLQEHVTCPVCLDVFNDPHSLECRHIVCLSCLNRLKRRGRLQCPECREEMPFKKIKQDLKMAKLAENFKKEKESTEGIPDRQPSGCEVCYIPGKAVVSSCKTCDTYLCQSCELAHKGVRATKNHVVESEAEIILAVQDKAKTILENSKQDLEKVEQNLSDISASIALINKKKVIQLAELNVRIDRLIHQLESHRVKLKHELINRNDKTLETLTQNKQVFENQQTLLQGSIVRLTQLSTSNDLETLMGPTATVTGNLSEQSESIEVDIRQCECIQDSPVKVVYGYKPDFNVKTYVAVHSENAFYADLLKVTCEMDYEVSICQDEEDFKMLKMCVINDELWCCGGDEIKIRYSNYYTDREITHDEMKNTSRLTKGVNGDVFVACAQNYGLHQLNFKEGKYEEKYVCEILEGSFSDVCYYNQHLYALNYEQKKIYVLGKDDSQWDKKTELEVEDTITVNHKAKMFVNRHGVFISSTEDQRIYQFSHKGDLMQTAGMSPENDDDENDIADDEADEVDDEVDDEDDDYEENDDGVGILGCPYLCGVDSDGIALVADYYTNHNRFQLYNINDHTWQVISTLQDIKEPISAVIDGKDLFIATSVGVEKYKLI